MIAKVLAFVGIQTQMPLTFKASTLTVRPMMHLSVTVPPSKGIFFMNHWKHPFFIEDPLMFHNVSQNIFNW